MILSMEHSNQEINKELTQYSQRKKSSRFTGNMYLKKNYFALLYIRELNYVIHAIAVMKLY